MRPARGATGCKHSLRGGGLLLRRHAPGPLLSDAGATHVRQGSGGVRRLGDDRQLPVRPYLTFVDRVPLLVAEAIPAVMICVALTGPAFKELTHADLALPPSVVHVSGNFDPGTATGIHREPNAGHAQPVRSYPRGAAIVHSA
jgi:hypothetical protein